MELFGAVAIAIGLIAAPIFFLRNPRSWSQWGAALGLVYGIAGSFFALESSTHGVIDDTRLFRIAGFLWILLLVISRSVMWRKLNINSPSRIKLLSILFLLPIWCVIGTGMEILNRKFDFSSTRLHRQVIWGKDFGRNPDAPGHYFFWIDWWSQPGKPIMVSGVDKDTYDRAIPRKSVLKVSSHPGALGFEWIESYTLEE